MSEILVTGGTGTLGKQIVRQLVNQGKRVSVLSSKENPQIPPHVKLFKGDLVANVGLIKATDDAKIIIHCASNPQNPKQVDINGTQHLLETARKNQLQHFIYISIVGINKSHYPYYIAKAKVEQIIQQSGIPWSILRATQFHNLVLFLIKSFRKDQNSSVIVPKGMKFQSIDISEVASRLVKLANEEPAGRLPDLGGPQILDIEEMTSTYLKIYRKEKFKILSKPVESELYDVFRSDINLRPQKRQGEITWNQFLANHFNRNL